MPALNLGAPVPALNLGAPKEDMPMQIDNSTTKKEVVGKLNIGKAVAIQQQQLEKNDKLSGLSLPIKDVEERKKPFSLGLNLPAKVEKPSA